MLNRLYVIPMALAALSLRLVAGAPALKAQAPAQPGNGTAAPKPSDLKTFQEVVKDAREIKGFFTLWQKDEKVWVEIRPEQLDQPFFFQANLSRGLGEAYLYGGMMLENNSQHHLAAFHKVGPQMQFLMKNAVQTAMGGGPVAEAVTAGFSDSLIASAPVLCQPHPERKSVLVDASALLFSDIPAITLRLEQAYRQGYTFDARNTSFQKLKGTDEETTLDVQAHFHLAHVALPPSHPTPGMPVPSLPDTLADPRSMFLGMLYSFRKLPTDLMPARLADDRLGFFTTRTLDFSEATDPAKDRVVHYITRWRLEKKDPAAALSEPKTPIVYWVDRNIPEKWRKPITEGILEWNKAFEKIGFKDAVQVKVQPADAEWDTLDACHASVRWLVYSDLGFAAIGPSNYDPRTGEILDADVGFSEALVRRGYDMWKQETGRRDATGFQAQEALDLQEAKQNVDLAASILEARGELPAEGPAFDAFMAQWVKYIAIHEVGHTLGLTHNFRGSTIYSWQQLADPAFTRTYGLAASIMEYMATNLAPKGEKQGEPFMTTLGPYDYWAVEYAYKPMDPSKEKEELARIAARCQEKDLAFGRDEEVAGMDPEVNVWDIGPDVLEFAQREVKIYREVVASLESKSLQPGQSYEVLSRRLGAAWLTLGRATSYAAKNIGGVVHLRDHAGSPRLPLNPVPAARQRETLKFLESSLFSDGLFSFKPELLKKLTVDRTAFAGVNLDFDLHGRILGLQRAVLSQLMEPGVAKRILNMEAKVSEPRQAFRLSELYDGLQHAVWNDLRGAKDPSAIRRNLQREHLRLLSGQVLRGDPGLPADARSLARESLRSLQASLKLATTKPAYGKESKAHFQECLALINETLKASFQRNG